MKWTDPIWIFGFALLGCWLVIILAVGLGEVKPETSFGLDKAIDGLKYMSGGWSACVFGKTMFKENSNGRREDSAGLPGKDGAGIKDGSDTSA